MIIYTSSSIKVRELEESDQTLLIKWLNDPNILTYYGGRDRPHDLSMVIEDFYKEEEHVVRCIIEYDHTPIGYIQYYPLDAEGCEEYGFLKNEDEAIFATDQFIGEADYWNKGIGKQLVLSMINFLTAQLNADRIVMDPQEWNIRAITCYERCGFKKIKLLKNHELHEGKLRDCWLMEYSKGHQSDIGT